MLTWIERAGFAFMWGCLRAFDAWRLAKRQKRMQGRPDAEDDADLRRARELDRLRDAPGPGGT